MNSENNFREPSKVARKSRTRNKRRHAKSSASTEVSKKVFLGADGASKSRGGSQKASSHKAWDNNKLGQGTGNSQNGAASRKKRASTDSAQASQGKQRSRAGKGKSYSSSNQVLDGKSSKRRANGSGSNDLYNLFGQRINKSRSNSRHLYQPEYNSIELPKQPEHLCCAICGKEFSGKAEMLESLEIRDGEFASSNNGNSVAEEFQAAHFECLIDALTESCHLEKGESVAYMGAGKFAIVQGPQRLVKCMIERNDWQQNSSLSPLNWSKWRQNLGSHTLLATLSIKTDV